MVNRGSGSMEMDKENILKTNILHYEKAQN